MIILPEFDDFRKHDKYASPYGVINQATKLARELKHGEAKDLFADISEEHLMSYAISLELLAEYHSWLTAQLASPDLKMW